LPVWVDMATIIIGHRLFANSEDEAKEKGLPLLENLWECLSKSLEAVKKDCLNRYPDLIMEISSLEKEFVYFDQWDKQDGKKVWDLSYWAEVKATSPDGDPECDFKIDQYDQWQKLGEPMYKDVYEPLYDCDWSSIKPFCDVDSDTIGDIVSVQFDAVKAVDSYHGGIHFYNNNEWL